MNGFTSEVGSNRGPAGAAPVAGAAGCCGLWEQAARSNAKNTELRAFDIQEFDIVIEVT